MAVLPIIDFEDKIAETVAENPVVVIIGETGSGKSTQLSQILDRRGYSRSGAIAVTQPRRVAAVSVARRVAFELGVRLGEEVGYAIRFEDRTSDKTRIKYLTDGCLLRESLSNPELNQYSVIILDEAHERSMNTDILLGLMKHLIKRRSSSLKVLITSATLDGVKVSRFFSGCPVLNVPGTLFPVEKLYSTERPTNYVESCLKVALDIHAREPPGDVLIFMTGQDDIDKMVFKLEERIQNLEEGSCMDAIVLPLHGSLPPEMQIRVFSPAPQNCRRFIVATNIAETSLTVDGIVYVIDSGFVKQRQYNPSTGMYSLDIVQIKLPLEPSLARTLFEANELGCLSQALTVTAMLSAEVAVRPTRSKSNEKKRKQSFPKLPDGSGWGDHIQLLQVYENWDQAGYDPSWCSHNELQVRSMMFSKDVRKQLSQIVQKIAKGPLDVESGLRQKKSDKDYQKLRRALCKGYGNQLAERMLHHNGYHTLGYRSQLVQVHPSSVLEGDEDGQLPDYVVYHELISTSRSFMRNVCAVEMSWVQPILKKLEKMDANKLSGGSGTLENHETITDTRINSAVEVVNVNNTPGSVDSKIQAARERYLARKAKR